MADPATLFDLSGKVACVTGASSGLGRRAAQVLAAAGAQVVGVARRADALANLVSELGAERAVAVTADISERDRMDRLAKAISDP
ncbi:MAG: SDR family NAD(P)-dependent oxidoreductase, partial [Pseudomonadota bacterium]